MDSYNVDEYARAVFDNFQVVCNDNESCAETSQLRDDFPSYLKVTLLLSKEMQENKWVRLRESRTCQGLSHAT